ncbi:MAG: sulfite exporter TauE/SafE family protein [Chloroflexi bacterium]|nr:sulfite exporter TauE/SafE family protein [Chloroflexota bacterium]
MISSVQLILLGALSGFVSGLTGFGSGLILMGTLVTVMPVQQATVVGAVLAVVLAAVNLWSVRHDLPWPELWPTLLTGVPAVAVGVWLLRVLSDDVLKIGVVTIILAGVVTVLWTPKGRRFGARWLNLVAGAASGVFNGALGTGGPPLVLFALLRGWEKECCKAYYSALFLLMGAFRLVLLVSQGLASREALEQGVLILVPVVGAWYLGKQVFQRVSTQVFRYSGVALLLGIAANLLVSL